MPRTLLLLLLLPACQPSRVCTDLAAVSVMVDVISPVGGAGDPLTVTWSQAGGAETPCEPWTDGMYACGIEVLGEITLRADAWGYEPFETTVTVLSDGCHPIQQSVTVALDVIPCTEEARPSILATVEGSAGETLTGVEVSYRPEGEPTDNPCRPYAESWACGTEEAGTLVVTARADLHQEEAQTVTVTADECHVITEEISFLLDLLP